MRAVILAAGRGGRLQRRRSATGRSAWRASAATARCSSARSESLRAAGIDAHHRRRRLSRRTTSGRVCGASVDIVENAAFASTNSLYSLWLARDLLPTGSWC